MQYENLQLLIAGEWTHGGKDVEPVLNPATEDVLAEVPHASTSELDRALESSHEAFGVWKRKMAIERQSIMEKAARLMEERKHEIARTLTLEMGKPILEARGEIDFVIGLTRWYAEEGKRLYGRLIPPRIPGAREFVFKEPVGPVVAFAAWNFPGVNVIRKVAGALAAGCSIIIKASEETPGTCIAIARCFHDAGVPAGTINVVFGVPDAVSRHLLASRIPRKVSFTGSVAVGKHLVKLSADTLKRCTMELGGHAPVLVFDDCNIDQAVAFAGAAKFRNAGQVCTSPTRFYVHEAVYDKFAEGLSLFARHLKVGAGIDETSQMGPLIAERRVHSAERFVADAISKGGTVMEGGSRVANRGYFFAPTVIGDVSDDAVAFNEEPFGPMAFLTRFTGEEDVLQRANSLPVGLAAYVYTTNGKRAARVIAELEAGVIAVNHNVLSMPEAPFGGVNESGWGSEGGSEGLEAFTRTKYATECDA